MPFAQSRTVKSAPSFLHGHASPADLWAAGETVRAWDRVLPRDRKAFALEVARGLLAGRPLGRTRAAREHGERVLHYLVYLGLQQARRTRQRRAAEVAVHVVQSLAAVRLWPEVKPETARKRFGVALRRLAALGLVRRKGHVANLRSREGRILYDGTVVRVRLRPGRVGGFLPEDFAHPWRDLAADLAAGRTTRAWLRAREVSHSSNEDRRFNPDFLKDRGSPVIQSVRSSLGTWETSVPRPTRAQLRDAIVDLELVERDVHLAVDRVAQMMAAALDDTGSLRYFAGLTWRALRAGRLYPLAQQLERLLAEVEEGGVKKPGALLAARMGRLAA